jgi:hypothetical protein
VNDRLLYAFAADDLTEWPALHDSLAFTNCDKLIGGKIRESFGCSCWPADFDARFGGCAQPEVQAGII